MFGLKKISGLIQAAEGDTRLGSMITKGNGLRKSAYKSLGSIGIRDRQFTEEAILKRGRHRAFGIGAGAVVLNARHTGESTGARGLSPRTPGGFA